MKSGMGKRENDEDILLLDITDGKFKASYKEKNNDFITGCFAGLLIFAIVVMFLML